ncbi:GDSL-type esterase/lipase family protein [Flectobacillus major]|uniref:GDSL-type esterase/lipase family protein n=1 Tax=Flectobacillus major TaxID=103 RepID=UPI00040123FE|nr:GDSL-type esterase/lipase family protein [Flectobacillus major]
MFWYEEEVKRLEKQQTPLVYQPKTAFYGSSTFTLWSSLYEDFEDFKPVNLGFGGSTLAACAWYFDRVFTLYPNINSVVIYAGDNDLSNNRHPEEIYLFLFQLFEKIQERYGAIDCTYVSIKPSPVRWYLNDQVKYTNMIIKNEIDARQNPCWHYINIYDSFLDYDNKPNPKYYEADGLHFNKSGHNILKALLLRHLTSRVSSDSSTTNT